MERGVSIPGLLSIQFLPRSPRSLFSAPEDHQVGKVPFCSSKWSRVHRGGAGHKERERSRALLVKTASVPPPLLAAQGWEPVSQREAPEPCPSLQSHQEGPALISPLPKIQASTACCKSFQRPVSFYLSNSCTALAPDQALTNGNSSNPQNNPHTVGPLLVLVSRKKKQKKSSLRARIGCLGNSAS